MTAERWRRRRFLVRGAAGLAALSASGLWPRAVRADIGAVPASPAPSPSTGLLELTRRPANYESPIDVMTSRITPLERFYVRNHFDVPTLDVSTWKLSIIGLTEQPLALGLADLEKMPQVSIEAVLQCAGNGRALFEPRVPGVQWRRGAMGNATWTGVRLMDLLQRARPKSDAKFVELQGADRPTMPATPAFIRGIPLAKAIHPDTLLALRMNGVPLPRIHGGPARLVVPGWVADDWIKWVERIELRADEPKGFFYEKAYRFPVVPGAPGAPVKDTQTMDVLVVKSVIGAPAPGAVLAPGRYEIKGVSFSGGGQKIARVDVSIDGGKTWKPAALDDGGAYGFTAFVLPFDATPGQYALRSRATDASGAVQPTAPVWNPAGYLHNAIDGVDVAVRA